MHARFPPGVLLPLLDDTLRHRCGPCTLRVVRPGDDCVVALGLPMLPSDAVVLRVRSLLTDLHGPAAGLEIDVRDDGACVTVRVPYEYA